MKMTKRNLIILGVSSLILLGAGAYMFIRSRKNKTDESDDDYQYPSPITDAGSSGSNTISQPTYAECKAKNPFKTKDEVIAFQKYSISKGYNLGTGGKDKDGADGDYGCKTDAAYQALKDSYKTFLTYQSSVPKTQNDARQKAITNKSTSYLWEGSIYATSSNNLVVKDPRGKKLILKPNANEVYVRLTPSKEPKTIGGISNFLGVIKDKSGKEVGIVSNYYWNESEKTLYYVVSNFIVTLYDRTDLNKPIVNPKAGYISSYVATA